MRGMSSDGAIDKPRSVRPVRGDDRGLAGIALGVLLALSLVATVVMVFSDNPVWMRIGTLSALWAAFIGAFLVARYRRQAAAEAARVRDLHTVYELQLEREISARREHELVVEKDLRDSVRAETSDSIYALRHEIAALREQLGQMGVTLTDDRLAVGGDTAAGELGAGSSLPSVRSERVEPRRRAPESTVTTPSVTTQSATTPAGSYPSGRPSSASSSSAPPSSVPDSSTTSGPIRSRSTTSEPTVTGVGRDVTPSTERTEKLSPVDAEKARSTDSRDDKPRGPAVRPVGRSRSEPQTRPEPQQSATASESEPPKQPATASEPEPKKQPATAPERAPKRAPKPEPAPADSAPHSRHGEGGGLSVAELMARLGGDETSGGGRRHRHSAD